MGGRHLADCDEVLDNKVVKNCKAVIESSLQICAILRTVSSCAVSNVDCALHKWSRGSAILPKPTARTPSLLLRQLAENVAKGESDKADEKKEEKRAE